jgi:hypothetical protein
MIMTDASVNCPHGVWYEHKCLTCEALQRISELEIALKETESSAIGFAYEHTMMRHALLRIAEQLEPKSWDASTDGQATDTIIFGRLPHIAKFALDMAKDVNSRPGFKEYVYARIADAAATA